MGRLSDFALVFSVLAFPVGAAAFAPIVFLSWVAAIVALAAAFAGYVRKAVLTLYFAFATTIVNPMIFEVAPIDWAIIAFAGFGSLLAVVQYCDYLQSRR